MTMQKIQVFLREDQKAALKSIAARTGQKQSDLVRQGVDLLIGRAESAAADWRVASREVAGLWAGRDDLEAHSKEFRDAAKRRFAAIYDES